MGGLGGHQNLEVRGHWGKSHACTYVCTQHVHMHTHAHTPTPTHAHTHTWMQAHPHIHTRTPSWVCTHPLSCHREHEEQYPFLQGHPHCRNQKVRGQTTPCNMHTHTHIKVTCRSFCIACVFFNLSSQDSFSSSINFCAS